MVKSKRRKREERRQRVCAKRRAETHKSGFDPSSVKLPEGVNFFSVKKAGVYRLEIIPYIVPEGASNPEAESGDLYFERTFYVHRGVGADSDMKVCLSKTAGLPCPICEYRTRLTKDPEADENLIKDLSPKERQIWNVYNHAEPEKGVQVWDVSFHLFGKQLDARVRNADDDDNYRYYADPKDGMTLKVGFAEKSYAGNTYYETESIDFKVRRKELDPDLFERALVLDDLLVIEDYDKLKALFLQTDDDGDEDEKSKRKKGKRTKGKKKEDKEETTADEAGIKVGDEVMHDEFNVCEVVKISGDGTSLALEDDDGDVHKGIGVDEVTLISFTKPPEDESDWDDDNDGDWGDDERED